MPFALQMSLMSHKVQESLEFTKAQGIGFKGPKSKAGRREITLPGILVGGLRDYRKAQLELRMKLGAGKLQDDDLLLTDSEGAPLHPHHFSTTWSDCATRLGFPGITFHGFHASQLIDQGVDMVTISKRLGHANHHFADLRALVQEGRRQSRAGNRRDFQTDSGISRETRRSKMKGPSMTTNTAAKPATTLGPSAWVSQVRGLAPGQIPFLLQVSVEAFENGLTPQQFVEALPTLHPDTIWMANWVAKTDSVLGS